MANLLSTTTIGGYQSIHAGNIGSYAITSLSGYATQSWVQSQGYITGYTETDTLTSVTNRNATTSNAITVGAITVNGVWQTNISTSGGWSKLSFTASSAWGDGVTYGVLGASGGSEPGVMIYNPHIVWSAGNSAAALRLGRSGGVSGGAWYQVGTMGGDEFMIAKNADWGNGGLKINSSGVLYYGNTGYRYIWENGTWGINISGNAATSTTSTTSTTFASNRTNYKGVTDNAVAGQLMWKNYGNNHTIFDASNGTSPDGGSINNTNSQAAWTGSYPTLMGWNGSQTYGVRVDSARVADSASAAPWSGITGKPSGSTGLMQYGDYVNQVTFAGKTTTFHPSVIKTLLWGGNGTRYTVTNTYTGTYPQAGSTWVRTYELIDGSNSVYSSGNIYCGFWNNNPPQNITVRVQNTSGTWYGPYSGSNIGVGYFEYWRIPCGGPNFIKAWEITLTPSPGLGINLITVDIVIDNDEGIDQSPFVGRGGSSMLGDLTLSGGATLNLTGSANKYLAISPGNGYEAMIRYNGGSGTNWYVGKRTSNQLVGTESFHFYSEAAGQTVAGIDTSGNSFAIGSFRAPVFYDSNDTSYYGNFNGTSVMSAIRFGGSTNNGTISGSSDWGILVGTDSGWIRFGPANSSHAHIYTDRATFYFNKDILVNGNSVITTSNYTSYSPSLTGSGASGTWGISITGNSAYSTSATRLYASDSPYTYTGTNPYYMYMNYDGGSYWELKVSPATPGAVRVAYSNNSGAVGNIDVSRIVYGNGARGKSTSMTSGNANSSDSSNASGFYFGNSVTGMPTTDWWNWLTVAGDSWSGGDGYAYQMACSFWGDDFRLRRMTSGSWNSWLTIIHSGNIGSQSVSYATTAGTANAVAWGNVSSKPSLLMYYQGFTLDANTMDGNSTGFTYSVNAPYTGPIARFSETGYSLQLNAAYSGGGTGIAFRTRNGDAGSFNPWRVLLNDSNYTAYSPSLTGSGASGTWGINVTGSAGSVAWTNVSSRPTNLSQFTNDLGNYGGFLTSVTAHTHSISDITDAARWWNNMGQNHSTQTDFNSVSDFGFRYIQGNTNGPGTGSAQFYGMSLGLGNDYAFSSYALQLAVPRYGSTDKYISFRTREAGTWQSWNKISAGYADSAGSVAWTNVSSRPTALSSFTNDSGFITSYSETDTLSSVVARGNTTSSSISTNGMYSGPTSGRMFIGDVGHGTSYPAIAHENQATTTGYALLAPNNGYLYLNKRDVAGTYIGIRKANSDMVVIDNDGNVGVNTASPSAKIHIKGASSTTSFLVQNASSENVFAITADKNIGILTASPAAALDIAQSGAGGSYNALFLRAGNPYTSTASNQILFGYSAQTNYAHVIKTRHNSGTAIDNTMDFYIWKYGDAASTSGGQHVMTLSGNGNMGVGKTAPTEKLDVDGVVNATGYKVNGTAGYNGTVTIIQATPNPPKTFTIVNGIITNVT